jgi:hypothetical protein
MLACLEYSQIIENLALLPNSSGSRFVGCALMFLCQMNLHFS